MYQKLIIAYPLKQLSVKENFRGSLAGLAIGDALGMPVEGMSFEEIRRRFGIVDRFMESEDGLLAGEWTDDTEQALLLAESLAETLYFQPDDFADRLRRLDISHRYGPTSSKAMQNLRRGRSWRESGIESDTNGSAMRSPPIGLMYHFNYNLVEIYAVISSSITHRGSGAIAASVAVAIGVACILNEDEKMVEEVVKRSEKYDTLVAEKIEYAYQIRSSSLERAVKEIGNSIMAVDSVPLAFYCYFSSRTFEQAVVKAASSGGDTDTIAAITGALKGTEVGIAGIPEKFRSVKDYEKIINVADRLFDAYLKISKLS